MRIEEKERVEASDHFTENNAQNPQRVLHTLLEWFVILVMHELCEHLERVVV